MADPIVITGDFAIFPTSCGGATLPPMRAPMVGTGRASVLGKPVCVAGDERTIMVSGVPYTTSTHTIPGVGALMIQQLDPAQRSQRATSGGKPVLVATSTFTVKFMVLAPAQRPSTPNPIPDTTPQYLGKGEFESVDTKSRLGG